uniref:Hexosyltransferase n=1 Tax=Angiostrongylus cantonensis TaxID=6313 RepID=A0A158PBL0_ANGCA
LLQLQVKFQARDAIRRTWATHRIPSAVEIVFIVGKNNDADVINEIVLGEIQEHDDLLYVDVIDTYRNNTLKFLHSISYAYHRGSKCASPNFLFLVDDDYMVNVFQLYEGWMFNTTPFRFGLHKHAVSLAMYPFDRYPPYITAGAVLLSHNSFIYPYDDVYAGILAYLLKILPTHNKAFVFWSRYISKEEWIHGDVIAAHGFSPSRLLEEFPLLVQDS